MRYYYTDPLAAAWMAKHFGVQLTLNDVAESPLADWTTPLGIAGTRYEDGYIRFLVHPDSEHILEPQVGDLVQAVDGCLNPHMCIWEIVEDGENLKLYPYEVAHRSIVQRLTNEDMSRIIQRNGMLFMWPEKETCGGDS